MDTSASKNRVALALGSGAARGLAHIGVLRALAEAGVTPCAVAGSSIGAVVGGAFAAGRLDALAEFVNGLDWRRSAHLFLEASFPRSGLIEGRKIEEILRQLLGRRDISELPVPFRAVATDVTTGREVVIDEGDLVSAIRASISVPGIFSPARRKGAHLVDGGLVNPVPVSVARALGGVGVVAVNVSRGLVSGWWRGSPIDWDWRGGYNFSFYVYTPDKVCLVFRNILSCVFSVGQLAGLEIAASTVPKG